MSRLERLPKASKRKLEELELGGWGATIQTTAAILLGIVRILRQVMEKWWILESLRLQQKQVWKTR